MDQECIDAGFTSDAECEAYHSRGGGTSGSDESGGRYSQRDPDNGLWYDPETGDYAPKWLQEQLNSGGEGSSPVTGLYPYDPSSGMYSAYPAESPIGSGVVEAGRAIRTYVDPATALFYDEKGARLPQYLQKQYSGGLTGTDPYAGAQNARAERALQEQIRAQRIREAQDASDAIQARLQAAQEARLAGAKFAVTPSMSGGYFPGLQPDSPIVRQGLAQPFQFQPVGFNPERGVSINEQQVANDLAMIRRVSGQGG